MAYSNEIIFADGIMIKPKRAGTPDYVVLKGSINIERFQETLKKYGKDGWFNFDVKTSKRDPGKMYAEVDTYMLNKSDGGGNGPGQPAAKRPQPPPASRPPAPPPATTPPPPPPFPTAGGFEYSEEPPPPEEDNFI
jgi:hypothetical protein